MPAPYIQRQENEVFRQKTIESLQYYVEGMHGEAHKADGARHSSTKTSRELNDLERQHRDFVNATAHQITFYYIIMLALLAVCVIDILLFGGVGSLFAKTAFPNNKIAFYVIKLVTPLAFLFIELLLAQLIYQNRLHTGTNNKGATPWVFVGIVFAIVMPAFVVGSHTDTVKFMKSNDSLATLLSFRLMGLVIVAFVVHSIVIFSGRVAANAKSFLLFRHRRQQVIRLVQGLNETFEQHAQAVVNQFNRYYQAYQDYNQQFPQMLIPPAEFDTVTRELINERFGREIIQTPDVATNNGASGGNTNRTTQPNDPPHQPESQNGNSPTETQFTAQPTSMADTNSNDIDGENDYLRRILTRQVRDGEDEVRP